MSLYYENLIPPTDISFVYFHFYMCPNIVSSPDALIKKGCISLIAVSIHKEYQLSK